MWPSPAFGQRTVNPQRLKARLGVRTGVWAECKPRVRAVVGAGAAAAALGERGAPQSGTLQAKPLDCADTCPNSRLGGGTPHHGHQEGSQQADLPATSHGHGVVMKAP